MIFHLDVFIIQILLIIILLAFIYLLSVYRNSLIKQSRFSSYALKTISYEDVSLFDYIVILILKLTNSFGALLNKSKFFRSIGLKYLKFNKYNEDKIGTEYIALKILIGLSFILVVFIILVFSYFKYYYIVCIIIFIIGYNLPDIFLQMDYKKRKKKIANDLLKSISIINESFKTNHNIIGAITIVTEELDGPIKDEYKKILLDLNYGLSIDLVFNRFYERIHIEEIKYITSSLTILNKTGGNIVKVFDLIEKTIKEKSYVKEEIKSTLSSTKISVKLLIIYPFLLSLFLIILKPTYFNPLFNNNLGIAAIILFLLLYLLYIYLIRKIMRY